jgi:hypothetical protein
MSAVKPYGSENAMRRGAIPSFSSGTSGKWVPEASTKSTGNTHNYPNAHLLLLSPDNTLTKNNKVGA